MVCCYSIDRFSSNMSRECDKRLSHGGESVTLKYDYWKCDNWIPPSGESMEFV